MTPQLVFLAAWLVSGLSGLGFGLAAVGFAKRRLAVSTVAKSDVVPA